MILESDEQAGAFPDDLNPPNGQAVGLLPVASVQSSHHANTGGGVVRVYPDGLAFVDQLGAMRGRRSSGPADARRVFQSSGRLSQTPPATFAVPPLTMRQR